MRRFVATAEYEVKEWEGRATTRTGVSLALQEGLHAYALRQASVVRARAAAAETLWQPFRSSTANVIVERELTNADADAVSNANTTANDMDADINVARTSDRVAAANNVGYSNGGEDGEDDDEDNDEDDGDDGDDDGRKNKEDDANAGLGPILQCLGEDGSSDSGADTNPGSETDEDNDEMGEDDW